MNIIYLKSNHLIFLVQFGINLGSCLVNFIKYYWKPEIELALHAGVILMVFEKIYLCLTTDLLPMWRPIYYSFVCMLISCRGIVKMHEIFKNFKKWSQES